jgi:hypothetical protein
MPACPKPKPTKRRKRKIKSEYKELSNRLDALVSAIVRMRDGNTCVVCGSTAKPQAGHIFIRARTRTTWMLYNVHTQCARCNLMHRFDQAPYFHWFIHKYGNKAFDELYALAETDPYWKWSVPELREFDLSLTAEYERLMALATPEQQEWAIRRVGSYQQLEPREPLG